MIGLVIVERHTALVAVPQVHVAPVGQQRAEQLVGAPDGRAAAEGDVGDAAHSARRVERGGDDLGGAGRGLLGVGAPAHDWLAHAAASSRRRPSDGWAAGSWSARMTCIGVDENKCVRFLPEGCPGDAPGARVDLSGIERRGVPEHLLAERAGTVVLADLGPGRP